MVKFIIDYFLSWYVDLIKNFKVSIALGFHLFPSRTEKLSPLAPMVLPKGGRVGRRRSLKESYSLWSETLFFCIKLSWSTQRNVSRKDAKEQRKKARKGEEEKGEREKGCPSR